MKKICVLSLIFLCGCVPAQVRELSSIEGKMIKAYTESCDQAVDNNIAFQKARLNAGRITQEQYDQEVDQLEAVKRQGQAIVKSHDALDDWIQTEGILDGIKTVTREVIPFVPEIVDAIRGEDD